MDANGDNRRRTMNRRRFLTVAVAALTGVTGQQISRADLTRAFGSNDIARDVCYWEDLGGTYCSGGRIYQRRCEVCCAGGVCETVQCILVEVGRC
jgi:hypothetical protein